MKINSTIKALSIVCLLSFTTNAMGQSKKERKAETIDVDIDMYDGTESEAAMDYYRKAINVSVEGDLKGAIKLYKKSIKEDPSFVEAYDNMAVCYRKLGDLKSAIETYQTSIELYPSGVMAHMNLGMVYGMQKEFDKALDEYQKVQEIDAENPEGYYGTINIYLGLGNYDKAISNATKTVEIYEATESPHLPEGYYLLGLSYYYNGELENAKIYMQKSKDSGIKVPQKLVDELELK